MDENYERKHSFSNGTQRYENDVNPTRKRKVGHLEGEFKKSSQPASRKNKKT